MSLADRTAKSMNKVADQTRVVNEGDFLLMLAIMGSFQEMNYLPSKEQQRVAREHFLRICAIHNLPPDA